MKLINTHRITVMLLVSILLSILFAPAPVTAETVATYYYTGKTFNQFSNTANPPYTNILGSFAVLGEMPESIVQSDIVTWQFYDGRIPSEIITMK